MADSIVVDVIRARFAGPEQMQDAVGRLSVSGFDRADLGVAEPNAIEGGTKPASTDADARQARTLGASTAASAAGMAAAGVVVASGGAALPAVAAAAAAGAAAGGAAFAGHKAADDAEQHDRDVKASAGELVLTVRSTSPAKTAQAETLLRAAGATDIVREET